MSMLAIPFPALPKDVMVDVIVIFEHVRSEILPEEKLVRTVRREARAVSVL